MSMESEINRRKFLASAVSAAGSTVLIGVSPTASGEQQTTLRKGSAMNPSLSLDSLYDPSSLATSLTGEAADRLAIRRLVDAWAHCADRRLAQEQANLFTPDGTVVVYEGEPATHAAVATLKGRAEILPALAVLNKFTATTHFNGQSDVLIDGDHAMGETYCMAYQLSNANGQRKLQILSIRYHDKFVRQDHRWYFAERQLITDWSDTRPSVP
jgi:SnoaL-like domain